MQLGAPFPMPVEWNSDDIRRYAREVEGGGLDFVSAAGHVLAHAPGRFPEKSARLYVGPYHDSVTLFAHLAGITERLRFRSSILILPLHTTVLVAAAINELCALSGDRFELGVGVSWNEKEYKAAAQDVHRRGRRLDEQLQVLHMLWTNERVTFEGEFHHLDDVGLGRLPATKPKIWLGATMNERGVARMVAYGDGWIPGPELDPTPHLETLRERLRAAGRDPAEFAINARIDLTAGNERTWASTAERLLSGGATHLVLDPGTGRPASEAAALVSRAAASIRR
jgi:probable F420-dependent oxidoreductase